MYPDPSVNVIAIPAITSIPFFIASLSILLILPAGLVAWLYIHYCRYKLKPGQIAVIKRAGEIIISDSPQIWTMPFLDEVNILDTNPRLVDITANNITNNEGVVFTIEADIKSAFDNSPSALKTAVSYFQSDLDLKSVFQELFTGAISMAFLITDTKINTLLFSTAELEKATEEILREELFKRGVLLISLKISRISDSSGIMENFRKALEQGREKANIN